MPVESKFYKNSADKNKKNLNYNVADRDLVWKIDLEFQKNVR